MNKCCHCDTTTEAEGEVGTAQSTSNKRDNQSTKIMTYQQDNDDVSVGESSSTGRSSYRTIEIGGSNSRTVSYTIVEAKEQQHRSTAIILFYPLSGASMTISKMKLDDYSCSLLCVDRPSCYGTSPLPLDSDMDDDYLKKNRKDLVFLNRIRGSVKDALAVLQKEKITRIYILGVCIGHPYAVELCRQCLSTTSSSSSASPATSKATSKLPVIGGMTLVAPFVSTACPSSWKVARFGASPWIPSSLLWGATEIAPIAEAVVVPFLSSKSIESLLSTDEERRVWTSQQDFEDAYQMLLNLTPITKNAKGIEARLGVSNIWQEEVCDKFAKESGCGLDCDHADAKVHENDDCQNTKTSATSCTIPIRIHASKEDKLASLASVEWISKRCYGDAPIIIEETIHSHEVMTFLGGPPRNPVLLHKIAQNWGLLK